MPSDFLVTLLDNNGFSEGDDKHRLRETKFEDTEQFLALLPEKALWKARRLEALETEAF